MSSFVGRQMSAHFEVDYGFPQNCQVVIGSWTKGGDDIDLTLNIDNPHGRNVSVFHSLTFILQQFNHLTMNWRLFIRQNGSRRIRLGQIRLTTNSPQDLDNTRLGQIRLRSNSPQDKFASDMFATS